MKKIKNMIKLVCESRAMQKISIIIPVYNEVNTLKIITEKIENTNFCNLEKELVFIDDCSTDGSKDILKEFESRYKVCYHDENQGKGAAIQTALQHVTGDVIVIQDADLEYNPADYTDLLQFMIDNNAEVVYGSRFNKNQKTSFILKNFIANKLLTILTNILYNANLTDMETCYKAFKSEIIRNINIKSKRFDFEPEITSKILKKGIKIYECPISYEGRQHYEGKKITYKDGIHAIITLLKYRFCD